MAKFEDDVVGALSSRHPVQVWNFSDEVLREAVDRAIRAPEIVDHPREFCGWVLARFPNLNLPVELAGLQPIWPRGAAFPLAGAGEGKIGFVSASPAACFPTTPQGARLLRIAAPILEWMATKLKLELKPQVWVPDGADGDSVGLAALAAGLAAALESLALGLAPLQPLFALTGEVEIGRHRLSPVNAASIAQKRATVRRCQFQQLLVVQGQPIPDDERSLLGFVSPQLSAALSEILSAWAHWNRGLFEFYNAVEKVAKRLSIPIASIEDYLPKVMSELVYDAEELPLLWRELGLPGKPPPAPGTQGWQVLIENYKNQSPSGKRDRLIHLCHHVLERHANDQTRTTLVRLTTHLSDQLNAETALEQIHEVLAQKNRQEQFSQWLSLQMIAGSVKSAHRVEFVKRLLGLYEGSSVRPDPRLVSLAIVAFERLYEAADKATTGLRRLIGQAMKSVPLPNDALVHRRVPLTCHGDFPSLLGGRSAVRQLRTLAAEIGQFPVCNADFECFDPAHQRSRAAPHDDSPVVEVSWFEAYNFAFFAELRLPTRLEWLSAAIPRGWIYPYQWTDFTGDKVNFDSQAAAADAGAGRAGTNRAARPVAHAKSHCGCVDMTGNVWEWVLDWCPARADDRLHRRPLECRMALGGGWKSPLDALKWARFAPLVPSARADDVGFRCIRLADKNRF